jgi:hypothetical protein
VSVEVEVVICRGGANPEDLYLLANVVAVDEGIVGYFVGEGIVGYLKRRERPRRKKKDVPGPEP